MKKYIASSLEERVKILRALYQAPNLITEINKAIDLVCQAYQKNKKVLFFGNGGSASQAEHFAAELMGRFQLERKALKAIALSSNTAIVTAVANDYSYERIFSRQVEALAEAGDIAIGISTSGNSLNIIEGIKTAKARGAKTIGLTGGKKNKMQEVLDLHIAAPSESTPQIQECHLVIGHLICELVEKNLFK